MAPLPPAKPLTHMFNCALPMRGAACNCGADAITHSYGVARHLEALSQIESRRRETLRGIDYSHIADYVWTDDDEDVAA